MTSWRKIVFLIAGLTLAWIGFRAFLETSSTDVKPGPAATRRVVVLGFDGLDPNLLERWMAEGKLPNFSALKDQGHYQKLATTEPAQSPVAWASFATGHGPGEHGIFDFLHRDPKTYGPKFSIAEQTQGSSIDLFGYTIPTSEGVLHSGRHGAPFWLDLEHTGLRATVQRVPVTFPPDPVSHLIAGMGVPDMLGSQGTYTLIANHVVPQAESGGTVIMQAAAADGVIRTAIPGPAHPLKPTVQLSIPIEIRKASNQGVVDVERAVVAIGDQSVELKAGQWSNWLSVNYQFLGLGKIPAMLRLNLVSGFPKLRLYVSPVQVDPLNPAFAMGAPAGESKRLAEKIGRFHTLGMPEETWALNQGHLSEGAWLDTVKTTMAEGEAMLNDALARKDSELVVHVFVQTDRVSHMFWRGLDETHPMYQSASPLAKGAVEWVYREADRILGEVQAKLSPKDQLIVLSDHGFNAYKRSVHLNRWLLEHGHLTLKQGQTQSDNLFAQVDWQKTKAYAMGLNGIFINRKNREAQGFVDSSEASELKRSLREALVQFTDSDGAMVIHAVHDGNDIYLGQHNALAPDLVVGYASNYRASWQTSLGGVPLKSIEDNQQYWSGDHCIDSALVPGVLLSNVALRSPVTGIVDVARLVKANFAASPLTTSVDTAERTSESH